MKAISKAAVLGCALVISAFVFGKILSSSAQTGAASSGANCAGVAPWTATTIYKPGDLLVKDNRLYKSLADIWNAPPDNPGSAHWYQNMGECGDQPPVNRPPTGTLTAPATVNSGAAATFTVTASDPDGDPLTYTWTRPQGFTGNVGNTAAVTLTAPTVTADQQATIRVQVADGRGGTITLDQAFTVKAGGPANRPPTAEVVSRHDTVASGGNIMFTAIGSDPDNDPLTYTWTPPEGFTVGTIHEAMASLWAPTVTADRQATVRVQVSDGRGGTVTATKTITVKAPDPGQPPTVVISGPATAETETVVTLDASGSSSNNPGSGQLTFLWTLPEGVVPQADGATLRFTAPKVTQSTPYVFTVRVNDGPVYATKSHTVTVTPKEGAPCDVEEYRAGYAYQDGDQVSNYGELYTCKVWGWCSQAWFEPGKLHNGEEIWPQAWDHNGQCDSGEKSNVLKLEFSPRPTYVPKAQRLREAKPLTGVLRCGAEETPFSASWGETLEIKDLKACKYQLTVNAASSGHQPWRVPRIVEFKKESGETQTEEIQYVQPVNLAQLKPLPGVKVEVFAQGLLEPRQMALGKGVIYVGSSALPYGAQPDVGNFIYALPLDASGKVRGVHIVASGQEEAHGVAYRNGDLYYSTNTTLFRIRGIDTSYTNPIAEKIRNFPAGDATFPVPGPDFHNNVRWHRWHMKHPLMFNPVNPNDPWLYTMQGRACNTCFMERDPRYGTLIRYNVDTGAEQILAHGVRNSVGWDWHPRTGDIWWSDNNRQLIYNGDEMNRLVGPGEGPPPHFGSPYRYANGPGFTQDEWATPAGQQAAMQFSPAVPGFVLSDKAPSQINPSDYVDPSYVMGSGTAPLGVKFWNGYRPQAGFQRLLFATHGLGAGEREAGLEVDMLIIDSQNKVVAETPLITGWQKRYGEGGTNCKEGCSGRPVEFLAMPDGSLLVSDDIQGVIYRVTYDASGLPATLLKVQAPQAPDESIANRMVIGSLTNADGTTVRKLAIAWGSDALEFAGLPPGPYTLRLEDVGDYVPTKRINPITLSGSTVFNFTYEQRRPGSGTITITAPGQPNARLVTETLDVQVIGKGNGTIAHVEVPWGGSGVATVPYGTYTVRFPFVSPSYLPTPTAHTVDVDQGAADAVVAMQYQHVESMGHTILTQTCTGCHSASFFDDPNKAERWYRNGVPALIGVIKGMNVPGHCDDVCALEVSEHLFNVVWKPYLEKEADSSIRQVRLLTRDEYLNSVQDVLGVQLAPDAIPDDFIDLDFRYPGLADLGVIDKSKADTYYRLAIRVADQVDVQGLGYQEGGDNTAFVQRLGRHMYRHKISEAQSARLSAYLQEHGPNTLIAAMLVSPYFLYRTELGNDSEGGLFRLTPSEVATLLSFGFMGTTPSEDLLDKADAGLLETPDQIQAEVASMLQTERGQAHFARFVRYYDRSYVDIGAKPGLDNQTIADMRRELETFSRQLIAKPTATMGEMFNPGYTFVNQRLAQKYGIAGVSGDTMQRVTTDDTRGGLLHMGILHVTLSNPETTSLVKRGKMLREQMFCRVVKAGNGVIPEDVTFPTEPYTTRTYWNVATGEHASTGQCWTCHNFMNEGGAAFENYAADGKYRVVEKAYNAASDLPIDASGVLINNSGIGEWFRFNDARDISRQIPDNADAQDCLARSYYGYVQGQPVKGGARQTVQAMTEELADSGELHKMLAALATSDALLYRKEGD